MRLGVQSPIEVVGAVPRRVQHFQDGKISVTVFGTPIKGDQLATDFSDAVEIFDNPAAFAGALNGEFVILAERGPETIVINDRFAALPIFYSLNGNQLILAFQYRALWTWLDHHSMLRPDRASFFEMFHFQRLFGDKTLDQVSKTLEPATVLRFDARTGPTKCQRYWWPVFDKRQLDANSFAEELAHTIAESIRRKTSDGGRYGLLLSGGMDSRAVLAGFDTDSKPVCYTVGATRNNEYEVANELATTVGARHVFLPRSGDHYGQIVASAVEAGGAMFSFQHGHFCGLNLDGDDRADVLLHGHGLDYMFQGLYLPSTRLNVLGRPTQAYRLRRLGTNLTRDYLDTAKYRLKGIDTYSVLKRKLRKESRDWLQASIDETLQPVRAIVDEPYDLWDYLNVGSPSRHYTYLNLLSADLITEQRTVAFDNDIFDLYFAIPARIRLGTRLLSKAIQVLDPALLRIRNANTNLDPDLSPVKLTLASWRRGLLRRLSLGKRNSRYPAPADRSWPDTQDLVRTSPRLTERMFSLDLFDPDRVTDLVESYDSGDPNPGPALLTLITIDEFLSVSGSGS
jgi:asparagine synthase (glutamine-hydrolysing)